MKYSEIIFVIMFLFGLTSWSIAEDSVAAIGKTIKFDYTLSVNNEDLETSMGKEPLKAVLGSKSIIQGLEQGLLGMRAGEEKVIIVQPQDAYGYPDPKAIKEFPRSSVPKVLVGAVIQAKAPDGQSFPAVVKEYRGNKVVLDFNHPLAGKVLTFKVKVLDVSNDSGMLAATPSPKSQAAKKCEGVVGGPEWTACMGLK